MASPETLRHYGVELILDAAAQDAALHAGGDYAGADADLAARTRETGLDAIALAADLEQAARTRHPSTLSLRLAADGPGDAA